MNLDHVDLLAYLWGLLDEEHSRRVESQLILDAEWRSRLELLNCAIEPLEHDSQHVEPEPLLIVRTMERLRIRFVDTEAEEPMENA